MLDVPSQLNGVLNVKVLIPATRVCAFPAPGPAYTSVTGVIALFEAKADWLVCPRLIENPFRTAVPSVEISTERLVMLPAFNPSADSSACVKMYCVFTPPQP